MYLVRVGVINDYLRIENMLIGKQLIGVVCLAITVTLVSGLVSLAAEESESDVVVLQGVVNTYADANGIIESVQLTTAEGITYEVVLDEKGTELGENMDGEDVEVEGIITVEDEQMWIEVRSFVVLEK
jgi:hypothetical protein